jgi:sugar lactone lactonase YvrE
MSGKSPFFRLLVAAALCGPAIVAEAQSASRVAFPGSIKEVSAASSGKGPKISRTVLRVDERASPITFEVALRMRSFAELQARIAAGEQIAPAEMAAKYFPLAADHDRLVQWLKSQGLQVTRTDPDRLAVFGIGSVDAVASAFQVTFARVADTDGNEYSSAITAPSLPPEISISVLGIHGLQPHIRRHPLSLPRIQQPRAITLGTGYLPSQVAAAYNATGLSVNGAGQTIAIYALAYPALSDLEAFWTAAGISQNINNIQTIDVAGGPAPSPSSGSSEEAALDVEWTSSLAPGASIRVYGANENDPADNDEILQQVYADVPAQPTMHQLCICIGGNETEVDHDYLVIEAQYMANLASAGISVLVASGDQGAIDDKVLQTTYPTSDPDVTGVGGTSLTLGTGGAVTSETAWSGSGGGVSTVFNRPSWQTGLGVPAGTMRLVPDVAATADPQDGGAYLFYDGSQTVVGGTSWAAPIWTAFCALLNEGRSTPLGLLNPKLYPLIGTSAIRDITSGSNGYYSAGAGYDLCTGVGVPDVTALLQAPLDQTAPISIAGQVGSQIVTLGQPATFFVVGTGSPSLGYQWQRKPSGSSAFANLTDNGTYSGTATPMLVVAGTTFGMTGDQFQCVVSGASGNATSAPASLTVNTYGVTTLSGWPGDAGSADGKGRAARFSYPGSVRADSAGNLYIADSYNDTVRKVTPAGVTTTVAGVAGKSGSTDGPAATALFDETAGVAVDSSGNLFVADDGNFTIREISAAGVVTTLAGLAGSSSEVDGVGSAARFMDPQNLAVDSSGNLYVADGMGDVIRRVTPAGAVTTIAGSPGMAGSADGTGAAAQFNDPTGIAVDTSGNVYVADNGNDTVRMITPSGVVTTLAGSPGMAGSADGTGAAATFNGPAGVGVDGSGNVYVADSNNDTIRVVTPGGAVTTVAGSAGVSEGTDGPASSARFSTPGDVTIDDSGVVYVADAGNDTIRRIVTNIVPTPVSGSQLINVSSRALVGTGESIAIAGFVIDGPAGATKEVLIRGVGPALASFGVTGVLARPTISVVDSNNNVVASNTGWGTNANASDIAAVSAQVGAFALAAGSADSALLANLAPGAYSVELTGVGSTTGVGLAEVYDADTSEPAALANISTRSQVGTGGNILIAGFVVQGTAPAEVLIRGVGPALGGFGVGGFLAQPELTVFDSSNTAIASNTGWGTAPNPAEIASVASLVGAFAFVQGSADCALLLTLQPGSYSAEVAGINGTTGVGMVEVYQVLP